MQMHLKSVRYTDTVLFPTIGNAVNVQSPDIDKPGIYCRKDQVSRQPILVVIGNTDKKLMQTYQNFKADRYPAYQQLETVLYPYILQNLVHLPAAFLFAEKIDKFFALTA